MISNERIIFEKYYTFILDSISVHKSLSKNSRYDILCLEASSAWWSYIAGIWKKPRVSNAWFRCSEIVKTPRLSENHRAPRVFDALWVKSLESV
jgi:hypothetical protein